MSIRIYEYLPLQNEVYDTLSCLIMNNYIDI